MSTLQSLITWLNLNRFSAHREAIIGFIKYISTGLTLQHIAKKRVYSALVNLILPTKTSLYFKKPLRKTFFTIITTNENQMDNYKIQKPTNTVSYSQYLTCQRKIPDLATNPTESQLQHTKSNAIPPTLLYSILFYQIICIISSSTIQHQHSFHPSWFNLIYRHNNGENPNYPTKLVLRSHRNSFHLQYS